MLMCPGSRAGATETDPEEDGWLAFAGGTCLERGGIQVVRKAKMASNGNAILSVLHVISFRYEMTYKFRENGYSVDYLVDFSVTTDLKNSR